MKRFLLSAAACTLFLFLFTVQLWAELPEHGVCAHRGNNAHFPENTLPAFQSALELGAAQIELDVYHSKDKKLFILHDSDVKRTTNGKGKIEEKTSEEIRALDVMFKGKAAEGVKIPTLEEVLAITPKNVWINIHVKGNSLELVLQIAELLQSQGRMDQAFLLCGRKLALEARKTYPNLKICNPPGDATFTEYVNTTIELGFEFVQPNPGKYPEMKKEDIERLKKAGVKINYFGVKNGAHCCELMEKHGVDFPLCDNVTECMEAVKKSGSKHR